MSDLPKTREYEEGRVGGPDNGLWFTMPRNLADAMRDELLVRVAELEEEVAEVSSSQRLDAMLCEIAQRHVDQAEAALAGRDRMLDELYGDYEADWTEELGQFVQHDRWLADIRARADEGSENE